MTDQGSKESPEVLVLAAGKSRRFGSDKRQSPLYEGFNLIQETLRSYRRAGFSVTVCLSTRSEDAVLAHRLVEEGVRILICDRASEGMGSTLAQALSSRLELPGVFVALADMPAIRRDTLELLAANTDSGRIVYPSFEGRRGHPVYFACEYFPELRSLHGDRGAADLIAAHRECCFEIAVDDPGVIMDVDTPADLKRLESYLQSLSEPGVSG